MELTPDVLMMAAAWFVVFLFSTTIHEAAHATAALKLGDATAYGGGQVTLNPLPHIRREPIGMVVVPLLSFFLGGWMFGWASAPYDPSWAHRHPKRSALMALAGPASNLLLVLIAGTIIRVGVARGAFSPPATISYSRLIDASGAPALEGLATVVSVLFSLNLILFAFNLLPLPPMDGSAVIQLFLPDHASRWLQSFYRQPMIGWVGILIAWQLFGSLFMPIFRTALGLLYPSFLYR
ncbi:MAG TPA: site-2 protease family protein [Thermoanaerobaculia bacterium]|nr:site-2 protease family protein [Thermoanaerobaculia bacterium]